MRRWHYELELHTDAVISKSAATAGGHESLDYVPGATLLGVAARILYSKYPQHAFALFHSGKVRFGNGYPLTHDSLSFPIPLSIFVAKRDRTRWARGGLIIAPTLLRNEVWGHTPTEQEWKQIRGGFMTLDGSLPSPELTVSTKTAIARDRRRSREGHLFAYQAVRAGTRFGFTVSIDDDVAPEVDALVRDALCNTAVGIGRSRSAEFGWAAITPRLKAWDVPDSRPVQEGLLVLYCHGDVALRDLQSGQPTLRPHPSHFGLPEPAKLDLDRTFIRTRRYSPFNGWRRLPDLERQVLVKGSVIVFKGLPTSFDLSQYAGMLQAGVGDYRECGLGEVWVQPSFLMEDTLTPEARGSSLAANAMRPRSDLIPQGPLMTWLKSRDLEEAEKIEADHLAHEWINSIFSSLPASRCPGPSQWGVIRERALLASSAGHLRDELFGPTGDRTTGHGMLRTGVRAGPWMAEFRGTRLVDKLQDLVENGLGLDNRGSGAVVLRAVCLLAARMPRELAARRGA